MNMQMKFNAAIESVVPAVQLREEFTHNISTAACELPSIFVDERGMILDCSNTSEKIFGYRRRDVVMLHVSKLFPELAEIELVQKGEFNPALVFLCRCGKLYQAKNRLDYTFLCNLNFVHLANNGKNTLRLIVSPANNDRSKFPYLFEY
jgi:hypothetical protein